MSSMSKVLLSAVFFSQILIPIFCAAQVVIPEFDVHKIRPIRALSEETLSVFTDERMRAALKTLFLGDDGNLSKEKVEKNLVSSPLDFLLPEGSQVIESSLLEVVQQNFNDYTPALFATDYFSYREGFFVALSLTFFDGRKLIRPESGYFQSGYFRFHCYLFFDTEARQWEVTPANLASGAVIPKVRSLGVEHSDSEVSRLLSPPRDADLIINEDLMVHRGPDFEVAESQANFLKRIATSEPRTYLEFLDMLEVLSLGNWAGAPGYEFDGAEIKNSKVISRFDKDLQSRFIADLAKERKIGAEVNKPVRILEETFSHLVFKHEFADGLNSKLVLLYAWSFGISAEGTKEIIYEHLFVYRISPEGFTRIAERPRDHVFFRPLFNDLVDGLGIVSSNETFNKVSEIRSSDSDFYKEIVFPLYKSIVVKRSF